MHNWAKLYKILQITSFMINPLISSVVAYKRQCSTKPQTN